jgi:hypothetical protein
MIVGYVSLKDIFVGSSFLAEQLFPAPLQNGGEPLLDKFLSSERVPSDDGSSQRELQVQSEAEDLTRNSLQEERASSDQPALQDGHESLRQHSLRSSNKFDDECPLDESSFQGEREPRSASSVQSESELLPIPLEGVAPVTLSESCEDDRECSSWAVDPVRCQDKHQALDEPSLQTKPEDLPRPSLQEVQASSDQPVLPDAPESLGQYSSHGEHELLNKLGVDDERSLEEASLQGDRQPRSQFSLQGKLEPLPTPLEGVAPVGLSDSGEGEREHPSCAVNPKDSSTLRGVDTFMVHMAGYLRSHDAAEAASELSNHDESNPHDAQSTSIQKDTSSARVRETHNVNDQESSQTELSSDNVAGAPASLQGPAPSTPDTCDAPSLEADARTDESNGQSNRNEYGPQSVADENRSDTDIQREQPASDLDPHEVDLSSAPDAVKNE